MYNANNYPPIITRVNHISHGDFNIIICSTFTSVMNVVLAHAKNTSGLLLLSRESWAMLMHAVRKDAHSALNIDRKRGEQNQDYLFEF